MREILFKAKRIDNGEWVYGNYAFTDTNRKQHFIFQNKAFEHEVDKDTICQYTGLTDKNGNKIWENDVVQFEDTGEEGYEYKEGYDFINRAKVEFAEARWSLTNFIDTNSGVVDEMYNHIEFMDFWQYSEVIGNIFDNPELVKGSEENEID